MKQENEIHTYARAANFRAKVSLLQLKRGFSNFTNRKIQKLSVGKNLSDKPIIAESKTPLWTESAPEEQFLLAGKVHNLRLAVRKLNGLKVPANEIFSFWKCVGQASRFNGYVEGRELREGCIIPSIGGGLCQISSERLIWLCCPRLSNTSREGCCKPSLTGFPSSLQTTAAWETLRTLRALKPEMSNDCAAKLKSKKIFKMRKIMLGLELPLFLKLKYDSRII